MTSLYDKRNTICLMKMDIKAQSGREQVWKNPSDQMPVRGEDISKWCVLVWGWKTGLSCTAGLFLPIEIRLFWNVYVWHVRISFKYKVYLFVFSCGSPRPFFPILCSLTKVDQMHIQSLRNGRTPSWILCLNKTLPFNGATSSAKRRYLHDHKRNVTFAHTGH